MVVWARIPHLQSSFMTKISYILKIIEDWMSSPLCPLTLIPHILIYVIVMLQTVTVSLPFMPPAILSTSTYIPLCNLYALHHSVPKYTSYPDGKFQGNRLHRSFQQLQEHLISISQEKSVALSHGVKLECVNKYQPINSLFFHPQGDIKGIVVARLTQIQLHLSIT